MPLDFIRHADDGARAAYFSSRRRAGVIHKSIDEPHLLFFDKKPMRHLLESPASRISNWAIGRGIDALRSESALRSKWMSLRSRLIDKGLIAVFPKAGRYGDTH